MHMRTTYKIRFQVTKKQVFQTKMNKEKKQLDIYSDSVKEILKEPDDLKLKRKLQRKLDRLNQKSQPFVEFPIHLVYDSSNSQPGFNQSLLRPTESTGPFERCNTCTEEQYNFLSTYPQPIPIQNPDYQDDLSENSNNPKYIIPREFRPIKMPGSHIDGNNNDKL